MLYCGVHRLNIEKGKVIFPWKSKSKRLWVVVKPSDDIAKEKMCFIMESADFDKLMEYHTEETKDVCIVAKGDFITDRHNVWTVPAEILECTGKGDVVFVGMDKQIEICNGERYDEYTDIF